MAKTLKSFKDDLLKIRTGRAHTGLLDQVKVAVYGQELPIAQTATISVGGNRVLFVAPWDQNNLEPIEKAIRESDLGLNPGNDGNKVIINLPELSEDRRNELVKIVKKEAENARVAIRNIRRDENHNLKEQQKSKEISENDLHRFEKDLQKITDDSIAEVDKNANLKAEELMKV